MKQLFSTVQMAKLLGIADHRITYAHRVGKLREASYVVGKQRVYTESDFRRVAKHFGVEMPAKEAHAG